MSTRHNLSKPVMIRMDNDMRAQIQAVAKANKLSASAIIRMAVEKHLPALQAGRAVLRPGN